MRFVLNPYIALPIAFLALFAAGAIWYFLVRPVPEKTGIGIIAGRSFKGAERVEKATPRTGHTIEAGPRTTAYTLSDRHIYEVQLEVDGATTRFSMPAAPGVAPFEVGQQVQVMYLERQIPFAGKRIYIQDMQAAAE